MFIVSCLKSGLKIYSSTKNIGTVYHDKSTWFNEINSKFFFDKGALFTAISKKIRFILFFQFLLRHREFLDKISFSRAFKYMVDGSNNYIARCNNK